MTRLFVVAAASFSLAAPVLAIEAKFRCDDGSRVTAIFSGGAGFPGSVALRFAGGQTLTLPQVPAADGGRYQAGAVEFWTKGQGATVTRDARTTNCRVSR